MIEGPPRSLFLVTGRAVQNIGASFPNLSAVGGQTLDRFWVRSLCVLDLYLDFSTAGGDPFHKQRRKMNSFRESTWKLWIWAAGRTQYQACSRVNTDNGRSSYAGRGLASDV